MVKADGVTLFAVGVGPNVGSFVNELNTIASVPTNEHVYTTDNFDNLQDLVDGLVQATCNGKNAFCEVLHVFSY